ncbi:MAG: tRNA (adenosine(37)-N6)-threonylcarbamoyltransferase complex ATPase subunit type 1 TsaE [Bacteroidia bacterium]
MLFEVKHLDELSKRAEELVKAGARHAVWCFYGEMGAGKTTLIAALCKHWEVVDAVGSPTYGLVNEYRTKQGKRICHFDFYRIQSEAEAYDMGAEDYFYSGDRCLIEWPERVSGLLPESVFSIKISIFEGSIRIIQTQP